MTDGPDRPVPAPRYKATVFIGVGEEMIPFGRTRDLSESGVFLETDARPEVGSSQEISFVWGDDTFSCLARVVRHAEDGIGLTFLDPDVYFLKTIGEIVKTAPPSRPQLSKE